MSRSSQPDAPSVDDVDDPYLSDFVARIIDGEAADEAPDIQWALALAHRTGDPVADIGCGTGRLTLPLLYAGFQVVALDRSLPMLAQFHQKLARLPGDLRSHARWVQTDMAKWEPDSTPFSLVLVGFNTFAALLSAEAQQNFLAAVVQNLRPNGTLAIATAFLTASALTLPEGLTRLIYRRPAPELGKDVKLERRDIFRWTDETRQIRRLSVVYDMLEPDGGRQRHQFEYAARYTYRWELEHLLVREGFRTVIVTGGYAGEPFSAEGGLLIAEARL